jgi:hypothetical protein
VRTFRMTRDDAERARARLELALRDYRVDFLPPRSQVERAAFPSMVGLYWDLTGPPTGLPPRQEVFATHLYGLAGVKDPAGVRARAYKAWASLVRQHHFELVLRGRFPLVLRGHDLDLDGLDFVLIEMGSAYGLSLSVETAPARSWASVKRRRHPLPSGLPVRELYLDLDDALSLPTAPKALLLHRPAQIHDVESWIADVQAERRAALLAELGVEAKYRHEHGGAHSESC